MRLLIMRTIHALVISSILTVTGCAGGEYSNTATSPAPTFDQEITQTTTSTPQAPAAPTQVTVPADLIGKNAQPVNVQLHMLGFTHINYTSPDGNSLNPQIYNDWTVTQVSPAPGTVVATTDTVTVTAAKKRERVAPAPAARAPVAPAPAAPAPPSQLDNSPPASAYYANCAAARAAGAAPLYRGQPGYRSALDRDGDGIACER
jgi:hypothetical protein